MVHLASPLYLASASPRRRELLTQLGYPFQVISVQVPEVRAAGEAPVDYVQRLARQKAAAGLHACGGHGAVLGADTIVVLGERVLEKPKDKADGLAMLTALSGQTHVVMTAVALASAQGMALRLVCTDVTFRTVSEAEMLDYWSTGEPCDKAGGYGIQGRAGKFVKRIDGSYSAVVGLPLLETDELLQDLLQQQAG